MLSINYCQLTALSTYSILYHLVNLIWNILYDTCKKQRPLFNCRTDCFKYSFFPNSLSHWSQFVPEIQTSESIAVFKNKLVSFIRPSKRSIFNVNDPEGVKYLTRLRLRFSHLNEHKFRHGFLDILNLLCNAVWRLKTMNIFFCAASILKILEGPSSSTYQALVHLLKIYRVIWKWNCFFLVIQNFLLSIIIISF